MYLKVYYNPRKKDAQVSEVKAALPADLSHLEVDEPFGIALVNFPEGAPYADYQRVREALQAKGFETE